MDVQEVMTPNPTVCTTTTTLSDAATIMAERDIGDVLVEDGNGVLCGIVTDRDLVVRGLAGTNGDGSSITLGDICQIGLTTVEASADTADVIQVMEEEAIRRVPVMDGDRLVGIVSLGDLAVELDAESALGQISLAPADH